MEEKELVRLLSKLTEHSAECEWIEYKHNFHDLEEIGNDLSALANSACIHNKAHGYLVFGVQDETKEIVGTTFVPSKTKQGNELIEPWMAMRLRPRADFKIYEFKHGGKPITLFEIQAARDQPVSFKHVAWIRVGSSTRKLDEFAEKERKIWTKNPAGAFEKGLAKRNLTGQHVVSLLDTQALFELLKQPYPTTQGAVLAKLGNEGLIVEEDFEYAVTNLGAMLFAKDLSQFDGISRKAPRVIVYKGRDKVETDKDQLGMRGYAVGFKLLVNWVKGQLPTTEKIDEKGIRKELVVYPELAIRELIANALIHQDFSITGTGPTVEIYAGRIEIINPGLPLILTTRFMDEYRSRNEILATLMRRLGICEEKGSGIDKVVKKCEEARLPAPEFNTMDFHTRATIFAPKPLQQMDHQERVRACYLHACLKYLSNERMSNQSLRDRLEIDDRNAAIASRIIKETFEEGLIKLEDESSASRKYARYVPFWA
jgi:predicted HTH transcriptional regulator